MIAYHLGIDSTDSSTLGMCTTYLGARIIEALSDMGCDFVSPPDLVRLNPNIPWKTRGNGAVCLRFLNEGSCEEEIMHVAVALTDELSVLEDEQANPGIALIKGAIPQEVRGLYSKALHRVVDMDEAIAVGERCGASMKGYKNRRGIIGALSAIGGSCMPQWTWEVIAYRDPGLRTRERPIDRGSIVRASENHPSTFYNVDDSGRPLCIPHSPCPVLFGIRGTDPSEALKAASELIFSGMERWVLWRTNQHTDAHIETVSSIKALRDLSSVRIAGRISRSPAYHPGGHLGFTLDDHTGGSIDCWAYEPTKGFRKRLKPLVEGDLIEVWGSVRAESAGMPRCINLEKVSILELAPGTRKVNPPCPRCGGPTGSMGKGQSLRCKACGSRDPSMISFLETVDRGLSTGYIEPPEVSWRHLYRPSWLKPSTSMEGLPQPFWGKGSFIDPQDGIRAMRSKRSNREQGVKKRGLNA